MIYEAAKTECWKCGRETVVHTWPDHSMYCQSSPENGRPETVRWMWSRMAEVHYWANACQHCGVIQGDFYLYCEPDGPFFGLGDDSEDEDEGEDTEGPPRPEGGGVPQSEH
jgi:hypothetical protein